MASFKKYLPKLQQVEGGYQNRSSDPGNFNSLGQNVGTNFGISARFYEQIINRPPSKADMLAITKDEATNLFYTHFWLAAKGDTIKNQSVAETIIDHQINAGNGIKLAQKTINKYFGIAIAIDGIMGTKTLQALNAISAARFVSVFNDERKAYYKSIGNGDWLKGWLKRVEKFTYKNAGTITAITALAVIGTGVLSYNLLKN